MPHIDLMEEKDINIDIDFIEAEIDRRFSRRSTIVVAAVTTLAQDTMCECPTFAIIDFDCGPT